MDNFAQPPVAKVAGILHELPRFNGKLKSISADFDPDSSDYKKSLAIIGFFVASLFICFLMAVILIFLFTRYGNPQDSKGLTNKKIVLNVLAVVGLAVTVIPLLYEIFLHEEILRVMDNYEPEPILKYVSESVDSILYDTGSDEINRLQVDVQRMAPEMGEEYWFWSHSYARRSTNYAHEAYSRFKRLKDMIPKEWSPSFNKELIEMEFDRHFFCMIGWSILILAAFIFMCGIAVGSERAIILLVVFGGLDFVLSLGFAIAITFAVAVATADACYAPAQAARRILPQSMIDKFQLLHARCYHWKHVKLPAYVKLTYEFYYEKIALDNVKNQMTKLRTDFQYWERENGSRVSLLLEHYAADAIRAFNLIEPSRHYLLPECRLPDQIMAQSIRKACLGLPNFIFYQVLACIVACFIYAFIVFVYISVLRWSIRSLIIRVEPKKSKIKIKKSKKGKGGKKRKPKKTKGKKGKKNKKGTKGKGITNKKKAQDKKTTIKDKGAKNKKRKENKNNEETKNIGKKWNQLATSTTNPKRKKEKKRKPVEVRTMTERKKLTNKKLDSQKKLTASDKKSKKTSKKPNIEKESFDKSSKKVDSKNQLQSTNKKRLKKPIKETTSKDSDTKKTKTTSDKSDTSTERDFGIRKKQKINSPRSSNKSSDAFGKKSDKNIRSKKSPTDVREISDKISKTSSKTKTKKEAAVKTPSRQKKDRQDTETYSKKSFDALDKKPKKADIRESHGELSKTKLKTKTEKGTARKTPTEDQMKSARKSVDTVSKKPDSNIDSKKSPKDVREISSKISKSRSETKTKKETALKIPTEQRIDRPHREITSKKSIEAFSKKSNTKIISKKSPKDVSHDKISKTTSKSMTDKKTSVKTPTEQETDSPYTEEFSKKSIDALSEKSDTKLMSKKSPKDVRESHGKISKTTWKPMTEKITTVKSHTEQEAGWRYEEKSSKKSIDALSEKSKKKTPKDIKKEIHGKISKTTSKTKFKNETAVDTPRRLSGMLEPEKNIKDTAESQKETFDKDSIKTTLEINVENRNTEKEPQKRAKKVQSEKTSKDTVESIGKTTKVAKESMKTKPKTKFENETVISIEPTKIKQFKKSSQDTAETAEKESEIALAKKQTDFKETHHKGIKKTKSKLIKEKVHEKELIGSPSKEHLKLSLKEGDTLSEKEEKRSHVKPPKKTSKIKSEKGFIETIPTEATEKAVEESGKKSKPEILKMSKKSSKESFKMLSKEPVNTKSKIHRKEDKAIEREYASEETVKAPNLEKSSEESNDASFQNPTKGYGTEQISEITHTEPEKPSQKKSVISSISGKSSIKTTQRTIKQPEQTKLNIESDKQFHNIDKGSKKKSIDKESKKQYQFFEQIYSKKSSIDDKSTFGKKPIIKESEKSVTISEKNVESATKKTQPKISDKYTKDKYKTSDKSYLSNDFIQTSRSDNSILKAEDSYDKKGNKPVNTIKPSKTLGTEQKSEFMQDQALKEKYIDKEKEFLSQESGKYTKPVRSLQKTDDDGEKKVKRSLFDIISGKKSKSVMKKQAEELKQKKNKH